MAKLNAKQQRFVEEYIIDLNATQAAIRAGYSEKTAKSIGQRLLTYVDVKTAIDENLQRMRDAALADAYEVEKYLTSVMRGESKAEVVVVEGHGEGYSEARTMQKAPDEKERLKAAELLGKRHKLFTDKVDFTNLPLPVFSGEDDLE